MGIGISIFLLALGGILWLGVDATVAGLDIDAIGIVLVVVGVIGLVWSLLAASAMGPFAGRAETRERVVERR